MENVGRHSLRSAIPGPPFGSRLDFEPQRICFFPRDELDWVLHARLVALRRRYELLVVVEDRLVEISGGAQRLAVEG
jgi:hypothetical protein